MRDGDTVGAYVIERRIGGGTFADVWLARHGVLRSRHAIKLLDPQWVAHPMMRDRFLSEGRILAQLRHPALVAVTDVLDVPPDRIGLVMEFVDGGTLADRIAGGALPRGVAVALVADILDGMHHAHEAGVIHRDLKPENILVVDRPDRPHAVVVDFGIAKVLAGADVDASLAVGTRAQTRMGTPRYMSPEQIESSHAVDRRSDVFSIGAILFEMLLGRVAFPGETATEVMYNVTRGAMNPATGLPGPLRAVVEQALAVSPAARFATCADFRAALLRADADSPPPRTAGPTAVPHTPPSTEPTFPPRSEPTLATTPSASSGAVAAIVLGLIALAAVGAAGAGMWWSALAPVEAPPAMVDRAVVSDPTTPASVSPPAGQAPTPDAGPSSPTGAPASETPRPASPPTVAPSPQPVAASAAVDAPASVVPPSARAAPVRAPAGPSDAQKIDDAWAKTSAAARACLRDRAVVTVWKLTVGFDARGEPTKVVANASPRDATTAACLEGAAAKLRAGTLSGPAQRVFTVTR